MRYSLEWLHFVVVLMTINQIFAGYRTTEALLYCWYKCKLIRPLQKTAWQFLIKLNIHPYVYVCISCRAEHLTKGIKKHVQKNKQTNKNMYI